GGIGAGAGERVEQRRLARVGVADDRHGERGLAVARAAPRAPLLAQLLELRAQALDADRQHSPVELELRLARPAAHADAAALAFQVRPAAHETRRQVLEPSELDLQLAFVALSPP